MDHTGVHERSFLTGGQVSAQVIRILRDALEIKPDSQISMDDPILRYSDCSIDRMDLQLRIEMQFCLQINGPFAFQHLGNTTVGDLIRYARIRIAKSYSDEQLYELIRLCFGKLVQVTSDQLAGLQKVNDPIIDSLGKLDETDWDEWRREIMLRLPIVVPEGFCRNTPIGLLYFVSGELFKIG